MKQLVIVLALAQIGWAQTTEEPEPSCMLDRRIVSSVTGETLRHVELRPPATGMWPLAKPARDRPGWYYWGSKAVEAATGRVMSYPQLDFVPQGIQFTSAEGDVLWTHPVTRPASALRDHSSVFVGDAHAVVSLHSRTGVPQWRVANERYWLVGLTKASLWVVDRTREKESYQVVALSLESGHEQQRFDVPSAAVDVWGLGEFQFVRSGFLEGETTVCFGQGPLIKLASDHMLCGDLVDGAPLIVSTRRVALLGLRGQLAWEIPLGGFHRGRRAWIRRLPDGDRLLAHYSGGADSGVTLIRFSVTDGSTVRWRARISSLGVGHSVYSQYVYGEVRGAEILVVSQAAGGDFVEVRNLATGAFQRRWCYRQGQRCEPGHCRSLDAVR